MPSAENILILAILAVTILLFISEKLRVDVIALSVLATLLVLNLITPSQALYGFANQATAIIAAMFVMSAGLVRTGLVDWLARKVDRLAGKSRSRFLLVLCLTTAGLSTFIINSAIVAIFIPISIILADRRKIPVSKVLIPMAFASQMGGVCTLIGSSTNILMNSIALENGQPGFSLFEFAPLGLIFSGVGIFYLAAVSGSLIPRRKGTFQKIDKFRLADYLGEFSVTPDSGLIGKRWGEMEDKALEDLKLIKLIRGNKAVWHPLRTLIKERDVLLAHGPADKLLQFKNTFRLKSQADSKVSDQKMSSQDIRLIEALVPPRSILSGSTLEASDFTRRFKCTVLAIQRRKKIVRQRIEHIILRGGDTLLLQCDQEDIGRILKSRDLVMTDELTELHIRKDRGAMALFLLALVIGLAVLNVVPILTAALIGAVGMIISGCLKPDEAYQSIDWQVIFLLGGILPLGLALTETGTAQWLAGTVLKPLADLGPYAVLAALYLITALLTEGMSNAASAILLAPVALSLAAVMGLEPRPFLMAITFAASTSFATPIGFQTNTMIYAPGGYRFTDFTRVGAPLNLIFCGIAVMFIPVFWPF